MTSEMLPLLIAEDVERLQALAQTSDEDINLSDVPELTEVQLAEAERAKFFRPVKQQVTARLDADVLDWLRSKGKGYQTRMNAILRDAMLNDR